VWAIKPSPGAHRSNISMPLLIVVRDILGFTETRKEARTLINQAKVLVDGKTRRDEGFPVGIMDVVDIPDAEQIFRVLPEHGGRFTLHPINRKEAGFKLCRIVGKTITKGGITQLNLHDGRNILITDGGETYAVNDVIQLNIPDQEITDHINFKLGVRVIITGGRSQGKYGILIGIGSEPGDKRTATIRTSDNEDVRTLGKYIFSVGSETPMISLPGGI
jgi:small subunit ribosomal protein S4e